GEERGAGHRSARGCPSVHCGALRSTAFDADHIAPGGTALEPSAAARRLQPHATEVRPAGRGSARRVACEEEMTRATRLFRVLVAMLALVAATRLGGAGAWSAAHAPTDPLPSWNEGAAKSRIVSFVLRSTTPAGPDYVAPEDRIAAFDQDGTLW